MTNPATKSTKEFARPTASLIAHRAVAESSFHHFVDYNWDVKAGCPSFLLEAPGNQIEREPEKLRDVKTYVENLARWLA